MEPASYTEEKFKLYSSYQEEIHHEAGDADSSGFKQFLVESPLVVSTCASRESCSDPQQPQAIDYPSGRPEHLPTEYGAYHQLYRLDGQLIAMGVIDILPNCVSSVYFIYAKEWEKFSLGRVSAPSRSDASEVPIDG